MPANDQGMDRTAEVTFVNRFTVHGEPGEFQRAFQQAAAFLRAKSGFLECTLLQHAEEETAFLNVARWRDVGAFRRATVGDDFDHHVAAMRKLATSEPGLYLPRLAFAAERQHHGAGQDRP
ncbi:hypothetical protein HEK616_47560 [Streptomyces nigrescens]|uniref:ABM domain-containing protein n=2 Tax=Streptomyces TaxID=1883 RepID=A0ABM7ZY34_STRNI|nr:antibiotic biosynthesis monooxygenase family protein [Streptomyces nigrescens]MEE4421616.1 antibiotic biosynthesis monooxygenase family protein [Streptomyces sp. DSM 41528]BDM71269.1 hypothetical protein HEK616_47560 [Streptomyces nigrescens]